MIVLQLHLQMILIRFLNFIYFKKTYTVQRVSCTTKTNIKNESTLNSVVLGGSDDVLGS